jgi:hypothetical protein
MTTMNIALERREKGISINDASENFFYLLQHLLLFQMLPFHTMLDQILSALPAPTCDISAPIPTKWILSSLAIKDAKF